MSYLVSEKRYHQMVENKKRKVLTALKELQVVKVDYGTLPYMLDVEVAKQAVEAVRA